MRSFPHETEAVADIIRATLEYNQSDGCLRWIARPTSSVKIGDIAGCSQEQKAILIRINKRLYKAHRVCWLLHYGSWPTFYIDHINGIPSDNRLENLRPCTHAENMKNRRKAKNNSSGYVGVVWHDIAKKWAARIRDKHIGLYDRKEDASEAYKSEAKRLYGEFYRDA